MAERTVIENGCELTLRTVERTTLFGITYWQVRFSFRLPGSTAIVHDVTFTPQGTAAQAEEMALRLVRHQGWGS
jgi:hypothetical protein